jgi:exopolyphosphatase/guanosine-5'-triphosphate,3'-diphosphate pyrophosphatase
MQVKTVHILATSAVREATNGALFMEQVEMLMQCKGHILSGVEEAHYAARGIVSGIPDFAGLVGDLGGGSLEFSAVNAGKDTQGATYELGVIRLQDESDLTPEKVMKIARKQLEKCDILKSGANDVFCAIGGTWRAFAHLMQIRGDYPLHLVQGYEVKAEDALKLACLLVKKGEEVEGVESVSRSRRPLLAYGAAVLIPVLETGRFSTIVFSSLGVREGYLFDRLSEAEAKLDPLIQACEEMCYLRSRSVNHAQELVDFTSRFMKVLGENESTRESRLRHASCLLSDIGWRGHRDYRGEQSVDLIAYSALMGVDHPGRAFMAEALAVRYMGLKHKSSSQNLADLMGKKAQYCARTLGALMRMAYVLSGAMPQILPRIRFEADEDELLLVLPGEFSFLDSLRLQSRLSQLARHLEREESRIIVE